jgi:exodeoxyribonuclease V alpha subunit
MAAAAEIDRNARSLRGTIAKIRYQQKDTGFAIVVLREGGHAVKGTIKSAALGLEFDFTGSWKRDPRWGWTFAADDALPLVPTSRDGIQDYLVAHCSWIGEATAYEIVCRFGENALEILKCNPEHVARAVPGLTLARALDIQRDLLARADMERVEVDVRGIVAPAGVTSSQIRAILDRWGKEAAALVRADPFRLIDEVDGVGWETADRIGAALGIEARAPGRIRAAIMHVLRSAENGGEAGVKWNGGDTCVARGALLGACAALAAVGVDAVDPEIDRLVGAAELAVFNVGAEARVCRRNTFDAESAIASVTLSLLSPLPSSGAAVPVTGAAAPDPLACLDPLAFLDIDSVPGRDVPDAEIADDLADAARRNLGANAHARENAEATETGGAP